MTVGLLIALFIFVSAFSLYVTSKVFYAPAFPCDDADTPSEPLNAALEQDETDFLLSDPRRAERLLNAIAELDAFRTECALAYFGRLADEAEAGETIDVSDLSREERRALRRRPPNPVTLEAIREGAECLRTGRNTYADFEEFLQALDDAVGAMASDPVRCERLKSAIAELDDRHRSEFAIDYYGRLADEAEAGEKINVGEMTDDEILALIRR